VTFSVVGSSFFLDHPPSWRTLQLLGHLSIKQMQKLNEENKLEGLTKQDFNQSLNCDICEKGKKANKKFKKSNKLVNTKEKGETIHTDICGPITPTTYGGNRYFISFIDDFTRKSWIYIIKSKDQAMKNLKNYTNYLRISIILELKM